MSNGKAGEGRRISWARALLEGVKTKATVQVQAIATIGGLLGIVLTVALTRTCSSKTPTSVVQANEDQEAVNTQVGGDVGNMTVNAAPQTAYDISGANPIVNNSGTITVNSTILLAEIPAMNRALMYRLQSIQDLVQAEIQTDIAKNGEAVSTQGHEHLTQTVIRRVHLSAGLIQQIVAVTQSLKVYRYQDSQGNIVAEARSPERGQLLQWLILTPINLRPILDAGADFSYADLAGVAFQQPIYSVAPATAKQALEQSVNEVIARALEAEGVVLDGIQLSSAYLFDAFLGHVSLRNARLLSADLRQAHMEDCCLSGADLRLSDLRGANLANANLQESNLRLADLRDAILCNANLYFADLREAQLQNADLSGTDLTDAIVTPDWDKSWTGIKGFNAGDWQAVFVPITIYTQLRLAVPSLKIEEGARRGLWVLRKRGAAQDPLLEDDGEADGIAVAAFEASPDKYGFAFRGINTWRSSEYEHLLSGLTMILLPGGHVPMSRGVNSAGGRQDVTLGPFLIAKHEVSQVAWRRILGGQSLQDNTSDRQEDNLPVDSATWYACRAFCDACGLDLPSEAQWEYACRGGAATEFAFGDQLLPSDANFGRLDDLASDGVLSLERFKKPLTMPVDWGRQNGFGLYNVHGNVQEWCADVFDTNFWETDQASEPNPVCRFGSRSRVVRGGYWYVNAEVCGFGRRGAGSPDSASLGACGFRPVFRLAGP